VWRADDIMWRHPEEGWTPEARILDGGIESEGTAFSEHVLIISQSRDPATLSGSK
jgi:hypothetical protein